MSGVCQEWTARQDDFSANTGHSPNAVSMLAHRLRRWANIETALGECPVFAGINYLHRWPEQYRHAKPKDSNCPLEEYKQIGYCILASHRWIDG